MCGLIRAACAAARRTAKRPASQPTCLCAACIVAVIKAPARDRRLCPPAVGYRGHRLYGREREMVAHLIEQNRVLRRPLVGGVTGGNSRREPPGPISEGPPWI
jgi:hypothetical protein